MLAWRDGCSSYHLAELYRVDYVYREQDLGCDSASAVVQMVVAEVPLATVASAEGGKDNYMGVLSSHEEARVCPPYASNGLRQKRENATVLYSMTALGSSANRRYQPKIHTY